MNDRKPEKFSTNARDNKTVLTLIAWAAVSYLAFKVFSGPSLGGVVNAVHVSLSINGRWGCKANQLQYV